MVAYQEEDVALPCSNSTVMDPKSCYRVKLIKYATHNSQMKVVLARPKTPKSPDAERVRWEADANGQMCLLLTKVQRSDEGLYGCEIWLAWDLVHAKNMSLKVKGKITHFTLLYFTLRYLPYVLCHPHVNLPSFRVQNPSSSESSTWATHQPTLHRGHDIRTTRTPKCLLGDADRSQSSLHQVWRGWNYRDIVNYPVCG